MWHVDDGELNAYLDGELEAIAGAHSVDIEAHLAVCESCGIRLEKARRYRSAARSILRTADPRPGDAPPFEEILRRARGDVAVPTRPWWRTPRILAWAASVTLAVGAGWFARSALAPRPEELARTPTLQVQSEPSPPEPAADATAELALDEVGEGTGTDRPTQVAAAKSGPGDDVTDAPPAARPAPVAEPALEAERHLAIASSGAGNTERSPTGETDPGAEYSAGGAIMEPRLQVARSIQAPATDVGFAPTPAAASPLRSGAVSAYAGVAASSTERPAAALQPTVLDARPAVPMLGRASGVEPFDVEKRDAAEKSESAETSRILTRVVSALANAIADRSAPYSDRVPEPTQPATPPAVRGLVIEEGNRAALVGTRVLLIARDGKAVRTAVADLEGAFVFRDVKPGTYHVAADRTGYELQPRRIVVEERGDVVVELRMRPITPEDQGLR